MKTKFKYIFSIIEIVSILLVILFYVYPQWGCGKSITFDNFIILELILPIALDFRQRLKEFRNTISIEIFIILLVIFFYVYPQWGCGKPITFDNFLVLELTLPIILDIRQKLQKWVNI